MHSFSPLSLAFLVSLVAVRDKIRSRNGNKIPFADQMRERFLCEDVSSERRQRRLARGHRMLRAVVPVATLVVDYPLGLVWRGYRLAHPSVPPNVTLISVSCAGRKSLPGHATAPEPGRTGQRPTRAAAASRNRKRASRASRKHWKDSSRSKPSE